MQCGQRSAVSGTGVEQKTQNLNPSGGFRGPWVSGRKRLNSIIMPPPMAKGRLQKYTKGSWSR